MGKHLRMKHSDDESHDKQPGCMRGLVHVLDYHLWQSNVRKMIHYGKYEGERHDRCDWSPVTNVYGNDAYEAEKLLDEPLSPQISTKRSRATKKRSLRARIKALISEEISRGNENVRDKRGFSHKRNLQRTYSIHHLESLDQDDGLGKICRDWKNPIIFLPQNVESGSSQSFDTTQTKAAGDLEASSGEGDMQTPKGAAKLESKEDPDPDVFEIFKVDKELLLKHLQDSDESIASFSRSAFGLNTKARFSKSRSFPVAELAHRRKLRPIKLESKQKEVWSIPRESKSQTVNKHPSKSQPSESFEEVANRGLKNATDRIGEKHVEDGVRKHTHSRSSSLNESLDKYARLFENSFGKDAQLKSSKSLKLSNEYGLAPLYSRRIHSLSYVDSYYSNLNFEVLADNPFGNGSVVIAKHSSSGLQNSEVENVVGLLVSDEENAPLNADLQVKKDYESLRLHTRDGDSEKVDGLKEEADKLKKNDFSLLEEYTNCSDIAHKENDQSFVLDSDICLQETEPHVVEPQISKASNLENDEISDKIIDFEPDGYPKKKNSDLDYVTHLLDQSGIAVDASEVTWHSSNQLFSPQLFEEVEARWPHEQDELTRWPDFCGCLHHQMLFDLVNEVLLEVYDISLPYYPKALSSSCHVRPFPLGNHITEEVCTSIGTLLDMKPEEKQSLDSIVACDLAHDHSWMNLQLETEFIALDLEDMIFDELLQEVIFS